MSYKKELIAGKIKELLERDKSPKVGLKPKGKSFSWLKWATDIQGIAQNGLTYAKDPFDIERYHALQDIASEMIAHQSHHKHTTIKTLFEKERWHATPKLDVRGAIFKQDEVLLVEELDGDWSLPGGWCDVNHSPGDAVVKEILEETGFESKIIKLTGMLDKLKHEHPPQLPHACKCFFLCEITGGEAKPSLETTQVQFFKLSDLPNISLHRVTAAQINRCYEHYLNLDLPTDYD